MRGPDDRNDLDHPLQQHSEQKAEGNIWSLDVYRVAV